MGYDENKEYLGSVNPPYIIPDNVSYISITVTKSRYITVKDIIQVEEGNVETSFEPYQESLFWKSSRLEKIDNLTLSEKFDEGRVYNC